MTNKVLSVLVYNHSGVLARVSSLFARRGFNIDSLTVSATNDPEISRITISVRGDAQVIDQILSQTFKLEETRTVFCLEEGKSLFRELLLVKVKATETTRSAISEVARIYGGHVVDLSVGSMIVELTGIPTKIDAFLNVIGEYGILEMCRTGVTALERGGMHQHMQKPPQEVRAAQLPLPGTHCPERTLMFFPLPGERKNTDRLLLATTEK